MAGGEGALAGRIVGTYQVGELIGAGSLAEVYHAQHPGLPWPVALKVFSPGVAANTLYMATMRDIAMRASLLNAGHILPVHSFEQADNLLYLSMPLLHESLRSVLLRANILPLYRAVPLLRHIAYGLAAAHAAGIIHRDLKPENVLLDHEGRAFVSDFGIGRDLPPEGVERRSLTTLASLIGAPAYMAPEQLRGLPTDQRTDVYALGVIFYEMLTGTTPYSGATIYEVAAQALTRPIPPPSQHGAGITPPLEQAMLRALARDPAERWPTVQRFIVGVNAALPIQPDAPTGPDAMPERVARGFATMPISPATAATALPTNLFAREGAADDDEREQRSGAPVVPDLRLFRVDPLPPLPTRKGSSGLFLAALALLALGVLGMGGALLVNAAQSPHNTVATPTSPPATLAPTQPHIGPLVTAIPTATLPPAPKPTATHQPTATATSVPPTATVVPASPSP
jgi:serine/threonine protein kinase